jgi:hypothetical protein
MDDLAPTPPTVEECPFPLSLPRDGHLLDKSLQSMSAGWQLDTPIPNKWPVAQTARADFLRWWQEHQEFLAAEHTETRVFITPGSPYYDAESVYEKISRKRK